MPRWLWQSFLRRTGIETLSDRSSTPRSSIAVRLLTDQCAVVRRGCHRCRCVAVSSRVALSPAKNLPLPYSMHIITADGMEIGLLPWDG